ncbi:MAG: hypothetical protein HY291_16460 [Planctomycetes bacterium]|nr:hypothetical protein [Planctomycetota bacterium]
MIRFALVIVMLLGLSSVALRASEQDDRIKKLEEQLKTVLDQNKTLTDRVQTLEKRENAVTGKASEIKMDAAVQKAIDNAVAKAGTGTKYGGGAFLAPDQPDIKGIGLVFTGEYMYTKVQKGDTVFAYHNAPNSTTIIFGGAGGGVGNAENTELDWSHGFRLGMGYRLPYDGWDLNVNYARIDANSEKAARVDATTGQNFLYTPDFVLPVDLARARQDFNYNKINLELGRRFKVTNTLSMRVFGGPSIVWFKDEDKFQYWDNTGLLLGGLIGPFDGVNQGAEVKRHTQDTLYGIRFGADGDFKLGHNVSIYGKAAGSLLTGEQNQDTFRAIDLDGNGTFSAAEIFQDTSSSFHQVVPALETEAGVAWNHKINENFNLKVSLGYQFTNYFNVLERTDALIILRGNREKSDLGMHGLVFRVKLDF